MADGTDEFAVYDDEETNFSRKKYPHYDVQTQQTPLSEQSHGIRGSDVIVEMSPRPPTSGLRLLALCALTVLTSVMKNVSRPVFAGAMDKVGGDPFALILYGGLIFPIVLAALTLLLKVRSCWWRFPSSDNLKQRLCVASTKELRKHPCLGGVYVHCIYSHFRRH